MEQVKANAKELILPDDLKKAINHFGYFPSTSEYDVFAEQHNLNLRTWQTIRRETGMSWIDLSAVARIGRSKLPMERWGFRKAPASSWWVEALRAVPLPAAVGG